MNVLIILAALDMLAVWYVLGFGTCAIAATITFFLFAGRKIGYFCKVANVLMIEGLGFFVLVTLQLITKNVVVTDWLWAILLRGIFLLIVNYDTKSFVYVVEEQRREAEQKE